jgi:small ligand-binding sensory domain FIST
MARLVVQLLGFVAAAAALQSPLAAPSLQSRTAVTRVAPVPVMVEEPTEKAVVIGAAALGGIVGVYLFHELSAGVLLAITLAYGATLSNGFGNASKTAGSAAVKAYSKTLELNEEYDLLPKAKTALDTATTAVSNLDKNYGITSKIDEQLKISQAIDKASKKVNEVKASVSDKLSDLKAKSTSPE